jgi:hypothetical protein
MQLKAFSDGGSKEARSSTEAQTLLKWLELGVFEALCSGFLHSVTMALLDEEEVQVLETYNFRVRYHQDGTVSVGDTRAVAHDKAGLKDQAIKVSKEEGMQPRLSLI